MMTFQFTNDQNNGSMKLELMTWLDDDGLGQAAIFYSFVIGDEITDSDTYLFDSHTVARTAFREMGRIFIEQVIL